MTQLVDSSGVDNVVFRNDDYFVGRLMDVLK